MTRDEVRSVLRGVGACGESDGTYACLLTPDHDGPHGFEKCDSASDGRLCQKLAGHDGPHAHGWNDGDRYIEWSWT